MNISYLDSFVSVVDSGSFSAAAKKLGVSQPAVSFQVQALERYLGVTLFDRSGQKLKLTPEGDKTLVYARKITVLLADMRGDVEAMRSTVSGPLSISASSIPGEYLAPSLLARFKKQFPKTEVSLTINDSAKTAAMVADGDADVGFVGSLPARSAKNVKSVEIGTDTLILVIPAGHALAGKKTVSIASLTGQSLVLREPGSGTRRVFEKALTAHGLSLSDFNVVMELGSNQAVISAVEAGLGFSVLSGLAADPAAARGSVAVASISDLDLSRPLFMIYDSERRESRAVKEFIEMAAPSAPTI